MKYFNRCTSASMATQQKYRFLCISQRMIFQNLVTNTKLQMSHRKQRLTVLASHKVASSWFSTVLLCTTGSSMFLQLLKCCKIISCTNGTNKVSLITGRVCRHGSRLSTKHIHDNCKIKIIVECTLATNVIHMKYVTRLGKF